MQMLKANTLRTPMSAMGHSLPRHPVPVATNVRYASNSDQTLRASEITRWAKSGHRRLIRSLVASTVGARLIPALRSRARLSQARKVAELFPRA